MSDPHPVPPPASLPPVEKPATRVIVNDHGVGHTHLHYHDRRTRPWWPLAIMVIGLALSVALPIVYLTWAAKDSADRAAAGTVDLARDAATGATNLVRDAGAAAKRMLTVNEVRGEMVRAIGTGGDRQAKIVVLTSEVDVEVRRASQYTTLWGYLSLGESAAAVRLRGNKVQWILPVREPGFSAEEATKTLHLYYPTPVLDPTMVVVQTDREMIETRTDRGWARLPGSAERLVQDAMSAVRPNVMAAANSQFNRELALERAREVLRELYAPLEERLKAGEWELEVHVGEEAEGSGP